MRVLLVLVLVVLASALKEDEEWATFKKNHKKGYKTAKDETYRRGVWRNHKDLIQKHNLEADRGDHSFRLAVNEFADMPPEEFAATMKGLKMKEVPTNGRKKREVTMKRLPKRQVTSLPTSVDWRSKGYVTPVKHQGWCSSCWAFAVTGAVEGHYFQKYGPLVSLSEQNLIDCSRPQGTLGCGGGWPADAMNYITVNNGIDTGSSYPYTATDDVCRFNNQTVGAKVNGYTAILSQNETDLQVAVANYGPVVVCIDAKSTFQFYGQGVYYEPDCSSLYSNHAVLVVGYDTLDGQDYWLVKNSWGVGWGVNGYGYMARNRTNNCGIATTALFPNIL